MRSPAVSGTFYPGDKEGLKDLLSRFDTSTGDAHPIAVSGVAPHAGYIYSGRIAMLTHKALMASNPETIVIIGPDHVGIATANAEIAVYDEGLWSTPLGDIKINENLASRIIKRIPEANPDKQAHDEEHSIEVQIPFIQYLAEKMGKNIDIVPVMMGPQDMQLAVELGETIAEVAGNENVAVLASSDMSHYVPVEIARKQDLEAIEYLVNMDENGFYTMIARGVSACGYGPATAAMAFARKRGVRKGRLLAYGTSSDVTGDPMCVGYASIVFGSPVV